MIKQVNGRWRSYRTPKETETQLSALYKELRPEEREVVDQIIKEYGTQGVSPLINTAYEVEWDTTTGPPVPIRQWVDDPELLGETTGSLYRVLKDDMIELFEGGYNECILCLHPDTRIPLVNGTTPTLKELADQWELKQEPFWVYSYIDGKLGVAKAQEPRLTGEDDYFRVTLEDDSYFVGNSRHQIVMRDGNKKMIQDMVPGDSIMPFSLRFKQISNSLKSEYEQIKNLDESWDFTHRIVAKKLCNRPTDADTIHHKNFKNKDNSPENLEWLTWTNHKDLHKTGYAKRANANPERAKKKSEDWKNHLQKSWSGEQGTVKRKEHSRRLTASNLKGGAVKAGRNSWRSRSEAAKVNFKKLMQLRRGRPISEWPSIELGVTLPATFRPKSAKQTWTELELGIDTRTKQSNKPIARRLDITLEKILEIKNSGIKTLNEASKSLGCSNPRIRAVLKENELTPKDLFGDRKGRRLGKEDISLDLIQNAIKSGSNTVSSVAEALNRHKSSIQRFLKSNKIAWVDLLPGPSSVKLDINQIKGAISAGSLTLPAAAQRLGCRQKEIQATLIRNGLDWSDLSSVNNNHHVTKIEKIGHGPVYCMTVPDSANFAINTTRNIEGKEVSDRCCGIISGNTGSIG